MTTKLLFMCPHNAAKSVLALVYLRQLAERRGLDVEVDSAGTEPDPELMPSVAEFLEREGIASDAFRPRLVTDADLQRADRVVTMGCGLSGFGFEGEVDVWDDIPLVSEDLEVANAAIRRRVEALADSLAS